MEFLAKHFTHTATDTFPRLSGLQHVLVAVTQISPAIGHEPSTLHGPVGTNPGSQGLNVMPV